MFENLVNWIPLAILVVVWIVFMRSNPQKMTLEYLKRNNELMEESIKVTERIASALEKIEQKQTR